ncbi:MAG TPA: DsbA family protein [Thermoleophilaceae bacterium]
MAVQVRYFTDPGCPWSWAAEPVVRRLMQEFGATLSWSWLMVGLSRQIPPDTRGLALHWLGVADRSGMPIDPLLWKESPIASTYPACMSVKAAAEQGEPAATRYLRVLREGLMCLRRKLDTTEAFVEAAREAGLDVERFRVDLGSHAIVEAFGNDLEEARDVPEEARAAGQVADAEGGERVSIPCAVFVGEGGERRWWFGPSSYDELRDAALAAGAEAAGGEGPGVLDALRRFGRMATLEVQEVCGLPGPRAHAELWRLASEWQVRPVPALTGHLWELA